MVDEIIYAGKFYQNGKFEYLEVGVNAGKISRIGRNLKGMKRIRLEGAIFPSGTDTHVHFRDPWETSKEDFTSGSLSALHGGNTSVFDMPNNKYAITDYERYETKLSAIRGRSFVDYGLYSLFTGRNSNIIDYGSSAIKIYLGNSTNSLVVKEIPDREIENINSLGVPVVFHAEDDRCLEANTRRVRNAAEHNLSRPEICEINGVRNALSTGFRRKSITHISSPDALGIIGSRAIKEVTPHHLLLNEDAGSDPYARVNPPLRSRSAQERLLQNFLNGNIDIVSSDHAPHTEEEKEDFEYAKSGIIGVETRIPLMLALIAKKILDVRIFAETCISNPARWMGLRKGFIAPGFDADFMTVRFSDMHRLTSRELHSKNTETPFENYDVIFPSTVIIHGEIALSEREAIDDRMGLYLEGNGIKNEKKKLQNDQDRS